MCRLLGLVAKDAVPIVDCLATAPRSLSTLSREHPDGWGVALSSVGDEGWRVFRSTERAHACAEFQRVATQGGAPIVIAHVRQKTVGHTSIENTHPFVRGRWVFAHNGTIRDLSALERRASASRLAEVRGDTDSERLFAFFLTRLDEAAATGGHDVELATGVLAEATRELRGIAELGAYNYLLSDGAALFAHRFGRTLHLLRREHATLVASEALTDEAWHAVEEGTFLRIDARGVAPRLLVAA